MRTSFLFALVSVMTACGGANDASKIADIESSTMTGRTAFVMSGAIADVRPFETTPAQAASAVDIAFDLGCYETLDTFSYAVLKQEIGKYKLLVSAIGSRSEGGGLCHGVSRQVRTIVIRDLVSPEHLELVNLAGSAANVAPSTIAMSPIHAFEVAETRSLCPEGTTCVTDGTMISLRTTLSGCVDRLGPVAFAVLSGAEGRSGKGLHLAVSGVELADRASLNTYCFAPNLQLTEIALPNEFVTKEAIELTIL